MALNAEARGRAHTDTEEKRGFTEPLASMLARVETFAAEQLIRAGAHDAHYAHTQTHAQTRAHETTTANDGFCGRLTTENFAAHSQVSDQVRSFFYRDQHKGRI